MDSLLDSSSRSNLVCSSVHDLQAQLHHQLASSSTDTRAEHASLTFEIRHNAVFEIRDEENSLADGTVPAARHVSAFDTVQNQPADDPVLQNDVAKHIVFAVSAIENSTWNVRTVSRGAQGWTFQYICKDSLQAWNRANARNPERPVIAGFSGHGGLDAINSSRPAFDCRGTLSIAFSKSSRAVIVKYEHTPLHKTVKQLADRLQPIAPPPPLDFSLGNQRTPKVKRAPPAEGEEGSRKKKTPKAKRPPPAEGEEGSRKKRTPRAKRAAPAEGEEGEEGSRKKRKRKSKVQEAEMDVGLAGGQGEIQNGEVSQSHNPTYDNLHLTSILNVPPAEAERRRQTAIDLLRSQNIDPNTLSAEQFNIFANQAPELQHTSLEMLARYGAERLRIVHPGDKEPAGSNSSTPAQAQSANGSPSTATTTALAETPSKPKRSRKKQSNGGAGEVAIGDGAVVPVEQNGDLGTTESSLRPTAKKTRGKCDTCKQRKVKCTKQHPACSVCIEAGVECVYLPPKPRDNRRKSAKSTEVAEDSDVPGEAENYESSTQAPIPAPVQEQTPQSTMQPEPQQAQPQQPLPQQPMPQQPLPDPDNEEFIPDPNILSGPVEYPTADTQPPPYYSSTSTYPTTAHGTSHGASGLTFPEPQTHENASQRGSGLTFPSSTQNVQGSPGLTFPQPVQTAPTTASRQNRTGSSASNRKSLPSGQAQKTPVPPPAVSNHTSNWNSPPTTSHVSTASPTRVQKQAAKRSGSRQSGVETSQQAYAETRQTPVSTHGHQSAVTRSPFQSSARTTSRQGHRSQTNTPVATVSRSAPPVSKPSAPEPTATASYSATASNSMPTYDPYARYQSSANAQYNDTSVDHNTSRIAYEPGTYHTNSAPQTTAATTATASYSSAPSYEYSRSSGTTNPLSQALGTSTGYSGSGGSNWPTSQTRGSHAQTSANSYPVSSSSASAAQGYGTRSTDARNPTQTQTPSYNQPSSTYNTYSSQQQQPSTNQQQSQQQNWYGFTAANSSQGGYAAGTRNTGYDAHKPNMPGYHSQYGTDDQSMYNMFRTGASNH